MTVLVAVASKHGGTRGIAEAVADELRAMGIEAEVRDVDEVADPGHYDAVVLGSAVYMGNWMEDAQRFVAGHREALAAVPVWLFSSGPLGREEPQPKGDPNGLDEFMKATGAREHRIFVGRLDKSQLGLGERLAAKVVKAPEGDFRDWEAIRDWAREIGGALRTPPFPAPVVQVERGSS